MRKGNVFKKVVAGVGVMGLLLGISPMLYANAAYTYSNTFTPPFAGCNKWESAHVVTGDAYVSPDGNTVNTTYFLVVGTSNNVLDRASDYVKTNEKKKSFTYESGFGGSGQTYRMVYQPASQNFLSYYVSGKWQP